MCSLFCTFQLLFSIPDHRPVWGFFKFSSVLLSIWDEITEVNTHGGGEFVLWESEFNPRWLWIVCCSLDLPGKSQIFLRPGVQWVWKCTLSPLRRQTVSRKTPKAGELERQGRVWLAFAYVSFARPERSIFYLPKESAFQGHYLEKFSWHLKVGVGHVLALKFGAFI